MLNAFEKFLEKNCDKKEWFNDRNMVTLSKNPGITHNFIKRHLDLKWNLCVCSNPSVSIEFINEYFGIEKYASYVSLHPYIFPFVEKYPNWKWNVKKLSENISLKGEFIEKYPHLEWDMTIVSKNPGITLEFIEKNCDNQGLNLKWDIFSLIYNPNMTEEFIEKHLNWPWDMTSLSRKKFITPEFIEKYSKDLKWVEHYFSEKTSITGEFIEKHPEIKWNIHELSMNPAITPEFIEKHINGIQGQKWNSYGLCINPSITAEFIKSHPEMNWDTKFLSKNKNVMEIIEKLPLIHFKIADLASNYNITLDFIEKNSDENGLNLDWEMESYDLSYNPNITLEFIEKHPEWKWNINAFFANPFVDNNDNKIYLLLGCYKNKNIPLSNFKNNILFDPHLIKLIFSYL